CPYHGCHRSMSSTGTPALCGSLREIGPLRPTAAVSRIQRFCLLAEDAVCLQPVSGLNSLLAGNLAGNFLKRRPPRAILASEKIATSNDYNQIPCSKRTGNFSTPIREFDQSNKNLRHAPNSACDSLYYVCVGRITTGLITR